MDFTGQVAIVTGAANGIGRATALAFAARGAKVVAVDRDAEGVARTAQTIQQQGGTALGVGADVTKSGDVARYVKAAVDAYGRIDCFFNNAGIEGKVTPIAEYDEDVFDAVIGVNVKGVFLGLRHVLPVMIAQGRGAIVNTASVAGLIGNAGPRALCGVQARSDRADQIGLRRGGAAGHPRQRGLPGTGRHADDPCDRGA